jgi:acetoin utilization protein AcuB
MLMPDVKRYMTRETYSIEPSDNLAHAKDLMTRHRIRHLPVIESGELVGMLSERDVAVIEVFPGIDLLHVEVARMMKSPLAVWGEEPIDEVATLMAQHKADCVIVRGGHGVDGIFTAVDALQALADVARRATA